MSEFKGTPGPWGVNGRASVDSELGGFICECYGDSSSWEQDQANAKLIAAAPELLEALQKIVAMNVQYCLDKYGDSSKADAMACVTIARAAIVKALGQ